MDYRKGVPIRCLGHLRRSDTYHRVHRDGDTQSYAYSATSVALDPLLHSMQAKPHSQKVDLTPTTTVGGETWDQIGAIGDLPYSGKPLSIKVIAMAINRPAHDANTKMDKIQFSAPTKDFDQMNSTTFQSMLQSFKFT